MMIVDDSIDDVEVRREARSSCPASRMPRRLPKMSTSTTKTVMRNSAVAEERKVLGELGKAVVSAAVPAEHCTATVTV